MNNNVEKRAKKIMKNKTPTLFYQEYKNFWDERPTCEDFRKFVDKVTEISKEDKSLSAWKKSYIEALSLVYVFDDNNEDEKKLVYRKLTDFIDNILELDLKESDKESRFRVVTVVVDILTLFGEKNKITYIAMFYDILKKVDKIEKYRNFYGEDARESIINKVLENTSRDRALNQRYIEELENFSNSNPKAYIVDFCNIITEKIEEKLSSMPEIADSKDTANNEKHSLEDKNFPILNMILVGCIAGVVMLFVGLVGGFFAGRKQSYSQIKKLEAQLIEVSNEKESISALQSEEIESLNESISALQNESIDSSRMESETQTSEKESNTGGQLKPSTEPIVKNVREENHYFIDNATGKNIVDTGDIIKLSESCYLRKSRSDNEDDIIALLEENSQLTIQSYLGDGWYKVSYEVRLAQISDVRNATLEENQVIDGYVYSE